MIKLHLGNVLLKPSHRRQVMGWLKRSVRLGERVGGYELIIRMQRSGGRYDVWADVHDDAGDFGSHSRQRHWRDALREVAHLITLKLHDQRLRRT